MKKKGPALGPAWLRGLMLVVAIGLCGAVWMDVHEYADVAALGVFSQEEWTEIMARRRFYWAMQGIMAVAFFYQFATWNWDRRKKNAILSDGIFLSSVGIFWICLYWIIHVSGGARVLWLILLAALAFVVVRQWRDYWNFEKKSKS